MTKIETFKVTARQFKIIQNSNAMEYITDVNWQVRCMRCQAPTSVVIGAVRRYLKCDCFVCPDCAEHLPKTKGKK
jgi:recombinational DNA repair protein (RecF pathway)